MKIIAGLGNPEKKYDKTYHNIGFAAIDALAGSLSVKLKTKEGQALTAKAYAGGQAVLLVKPQTYMNLSGESLRELAAKYKAQLADILVIYDDFDLPRGAVRIRQSGSAGTHNGMKSIIACLKSGDFPRIRIGIGKPDNIFMSVADYVLSQIPKIDSALMAGAIDKAVAAALMFAGGDSLDNIMQKHNFGGEQP